MAAERVIRVRLLVEAPASNEAAANRTSRAIGDVADKADKGGTSLISFGKIMGTALVAGAALAAKSVLDLGIAYQSSLNTLQAVSHATAGEMTQVSTAAKALGNDVTITGASAADAAFAMTELAKGGLTIKQSMDAARGTLQLAAAAQIDGAQAATIQSAALNTFGLAASDAGRVADVLANAANASSGEITDFAAGLAQSGLAARAMGVSLEDTATTLALFANNGLSGSDAGTSFKTMLIALSNPSKQAAAALDELGVKAFDSQGKFVGMRVVTEQLSAAQKTMTTEQFNAAAATAFGTDALRAAVAVAQSGTEGFDSMGEAIGTAGGAADLAAANSKGLKGAIDTVKNAVDTASISLFEGLSPALDQATRGIAEMIPGLAGDLTPALNTVGLAFVQIVDAILPLVPVLVTGLAPAIASLAQGIADLATTIAPLLVTFGNLFGDLVASAVPVVTGLASALASLLGPVAALPAPVVAFGAALVAVVVLRAPLIAMWASIVSGAQTAYLSFLVARGGAVGLAGGFAAMRAAGVAAMTALKAAFLSNPIGIAIVAITTAIALFGSSSDDATPKVVDFTSSVNAATGALNRNAQATLAKKLADAGSLDTARAIGIAADVYTRAVMGQKDAIDQVNAAIAAGTYTTYDTELGYITSTTDAAAAAARQFAADTGGLAGAQDRAKQALAGSGEAADTHAGKMRDDRDAMSDLFAGVTDTAAKMDLLGASMLGGAPSAEQMADAIKGLKDEATAADTKVQFLKLSLDALNGVAPDVEASSRAAQAAIRGFIETYQGQAGAARDVQKAQDAVTESNIRYAEATAKKTGKDYSAQQKSLDVAAAARAQADALDGLTKAQHGVGDASDNLFNAGQDLYNGFLQQTNAAYEAAGGAGNLVAAQAAAKTTGDQLRESFIVQAMQAGLTKDAAAALADQYHLIPSQVSTQLALLGGDKALQLVADLKSKLDIINGSTATVTIKIQQTIAATASAVGQAFGQALGHANGAIWQAGRLTHAASGLIRREPMIAAAGRNILWAEPETGGESYIPHADSKRTKARQILKTTAEIFGDTYLPGRMPSGVQRMANGGIYGNGASGSGSTVVVQKVFPLSVHQTGQRMSVEDLMTLQKEAERRYA